MYNIGKMSSICMSHIFETYIKTYINKSMLFSLVVVQNPYLNPLTQDNEKLPPVGRYHLPETHNKR